jgi:hypothetical protein
MYRNYSFNFRFIFTACIIQQHCQQLRLHSAGDKGTWSNGGMIMTGKNRGTQREKCGPMLICPSQIPHALIWDSIQPFVVRGQWPTASAMACPPIYLNKHSIS